MQVLTVGERFERYVVDEPIGRGGHATVYRAHTADAERGAPRQVALKVLDEQHRHRAQLARLRREFEYARRLRHPHIVAMYERGFGWLAMELVPGGPVTRLATLAERLEALAQIAEALDYAHNRAIVHCDVKPANILLDPEPGQLRAVLVDFGLATRVCADVGPRCDPVEASLPYSAPELLTGHAPTEATDEYALACTAVELITGSPPFTADNGPALVEAHLTQPPPHWSREIDSLPRVFDAILAKALAKSPADRYQSCREFIALVTRALQPK
ncbi:protein kinase [Mycolicibacterium hassiacum DSM 44199]|nr:protein kinase [Mycolicibacterium hassiacum DSM 44199]